MDNLLNIPEPWPTVIHLALIIIIGMIATTIIIALLRRILKKIDSLDEMLNAFIINAVKVICIILLVAIFLDALGVNIGTIVAVLGAAGAAVALALKDSLANVAGGLMILITQPFKKGDLINIGEYRGRVQSIDLFLTTLRTLNYQIITIVVKAKEIMREVCRKSDLIVDEKDPSIGVRSNDESAVVLDLMAWCRTENYFKAEYYLLEEVKRAFDEEGIKIPYPHVVVQTETR